MSLSSVLGIGILTSLDDFEMAVERAVSKIIGRADESHPPKASRAMKVVVFKNNHK